MLSSFTNEEKKEEVTDKLKGNINHSVSPWCYSELTLDRFVSCLKIGITGIDLAALKIGQTLQKPWYVFTHV